MKFTTILGIAAISMAATAGTISAQTRKKTTSARPKTAAAKPAAAKPIAAWVNFNGGEDVNKIVVDSLNVYVTMNFTSRMVVINKTSGDISEIKASHDITSAAIAGGRCFYNVVGEGLYCYDAASKQSMGPLFGLDPSSDGMLQIAASPDGRYLFAYGLTIDLVDEDVAETPSGGSPFAVNDAGGVFSSSPESYYTPFGGERYKVTPVGTSVNQYYVDTVTGNTYYCLDQGLGVTPAVPKPGAGVTMLRPSFQTDMNIANFIVRDDEGRFVVSTNMQGIGFGGKDIDEPFRMESRIATKVKNQYGSELFYNGGNDYLAPDGQGNLIIGSRGYACILIYNPDGLNGYASLKGKATRF